MAIYYGRHPANVNTIVEKKIYVEVPEGSTIDDMSDQNTVGISSEQYKQLQDAVNWQDGQHLNRTISQMITDLNKPYLINRKTNKHYLPEEMNWTRPQAWPNLDSLNLQMEGADFIYMTYDNTHDYGAIALHIERVSKGQVIACEIGHISNGEYITDNTITAGANGAGTNNYVHWFDENDIDYPVVRITGDISLCYTINVSKTLTVNGTNYTHTQMYRQEPILERIAWVPHLVRFTNDYRYYAWGVYTLQRDKVANGEGTALVSLAYAWNHCFNLIDLDISGLHTPNVTSLSYMFGSCYFFKNIDLRHFSVEKVTTFDYAFAYCRCVKTINLTGWNPIKATNYSYMFTNCRCLRNIYGMENFNTSTATNFAATFNLCDDLEHPPIEDWNVSNVTNFSSMFSECYSIEKLDLSKWRPNKATSFSSMFYSCWSLKELNLTGWSHGNITSVASMFSNCRDLQHIDLSWMHLTSSCTNIYSMFSNCWALEELHIPNDWDVSGLGSGTNTANSVFYNCYSLRTITGISNWNFQLNNSLTSMFYACFSLKDLDISNWNVSTITSLSSLFYQCYSLEHIDLDKWTPTNCVSFASMFYTCINLKELPNMTNWVTDKTTNLSSMFNGCTSILEMPDMSSWDFSNVTTIASMFTSMFALTEINLPNLNLPKCTTIATAFRYCYNLRKANLSGWNIPLLNTAPAQFLGDCYALVDLQIFPIAYNHSYANDLSLSRTSLSNIIESLPELPTGTTRTLNLTTQNINHLTAEERLSAANKHWTLAN